MSRWLIVIAITLTLPLAGCGRSVMGCSSSPDGCQSTSVSTPPVGDTVETIRQKAENLLKKAGFVRETTTGHYPATWSRGNDSAIMMKELSGSFISVKLPEGTLQCDVEAPIAVPDAAGQIDQIRREGYSATLRQNSWNCKKV